MRHEINSAPDFERAQYLKIFMFDPDLVLQERLSAAAGIALVITLAIAAAALGYWISGKPKASPALG